MGQITYGFSFLLVVAVIWRGRSPSVTLNRVSMAQLRAIASRRKPRTFFIIGLSLGLAVGVYFGITLKGTVTLTVKTTDGLLLGLTLGIVFGLVLGLAVGLAQRPSSISRPKLLVAQGVEHDLAVPLALGLALAAASGLAAWLAVGFTYRSSGHEFRARLDAGPLLSFASTIVLYVLSGLVCGIVIGVLIVSGSPWPRYFVATRILARHNQLPPRLASFLDWAYAAGLLRLSGISAQFRHRELQEHLTATPATRQSISADQADRARSVSDLPPSSAFDP